MMATEENNGAEFQEKTGLKRKLTGPPRLLLGKTRSPGQDEKKSRKHRRHNTNEGDDTTMSPAKMDEQSSEVHEPESPESPETVLSTELNKETCMDLQDECLEQTSSSLEQNMKKRRRRSKAGATIRRIFSCIRRRKDLEIKAIEENTHDREHISIQDQELLTHSSDSLKTKCEQEPVKKISSKKFKVRMWHIFKKHTSKDKEHGAGQPNNTFTEIYSGTSVDQGKSDSVEPPVVDEHQDESSGIDEDVTGIRQEISPDPKNEVLAMISLKVEVNVDSSGIYLHENHEHQSESCFSCLIEEDEHKVEISDGSLTQIHESDDDPEDLRMSPEDPVTDLMLVDDRSENANVFKCNPLITIEDVQSLEGDDNDSFENVAPRYGTLSPLLALNGSCYALKTPDTHFSEILLAQTALSLVRAAISGAVEQLSAELQSCQMDQDHL